MNWHVKKFDIIAPLYQLFFRVQTNNYCQLIEENLKKLSLQPPQTVLDLGTGTGAFGACWQQQGFRVTGVDASPRMVKRARKNGLSSIKHDLTRGLPFEQNSFDLVVAAYLAHGLTRKQRYFLYREAGRLADRMVVFHDYSENHFFLIDLIEALEGSNYRDFIRNAPGEMRDYFARVKTLDTGSWNSWYICHPEKN